MFPAIVMIWDLFPDSLHQGSMDQNLSVSWSSVSSKGISLLLRGSIEKGDSSEYIYEQES